MTIHALVFDQTSSGHSRITCETCDQALVHQPAMDRKRWAIAKHAFCYAHTNTTPGSNALPVVITDAPDEKNHLRFYSPIGIFPDGRLSAGLGGSLHYARRVARQMERERKGNAPKYVRVYVALSYTAGVAI